MSLLVLAGSGPFSAIANGIAAMAVMLWRERREPRVEPSARIAAIIGMTLLLWGNYEPSAAVVSCVGAVVAFVFLFVPGLSAWPEPSPQPHRC